MAERNHILLSGTAVAVLALASCIAKTYLAPARPAISEPVKLPIDLIPRYRQMAAEAGAICATTPPGNLRDQRLARLAEQYQDLRLGRTKRLMISCESIDSIKT